MWSLYSIIPNRDVVELVYRLIHNDTMLKLNTEYTSRRTTQVRDQPYHPGYVINMRERSRHLFGVNEFMFNYRENANDNYIVNYRYDVDVDARLPSNYWHSRII